MATPIAYCAGPYGKSIPVYASPDHPGEFFYDTAGMMDLAGVYGEGDRERCRIALGEGNGQTIKLDILFQNGGHPVPKVALSAPAVSVYKELPSDSKTREIAENWVTLVMDQRDWPSRAASLLRVIAEANGEARTWAIAGKAGFEAVHAFSMSTLITCSLEHLHEDEIETLEAAAFYALTLDEGWSKAGIEWLRPFRETWFKDWLAEHPVYREWAAALRTTMPDLPSWLSGGRF